MITSSDLGPGWYVEVRAIGGGTLNKRIGPYSSRASAELAEVAVKRSVDIEMHYTVVRERR